MFMGFGFGVPVIWDLLDKISTLCPLMNLWPALAPPMPPCEPVGGGLVVAKKSACLEGQGVLAHARSFG